MLPNKRSHHNEKPTHYNQRVVPNLSATRENLSATTKTKTTIINKTFKNAIKKEREALP